MTPLEQTFAGVQKVSDDGVHHDLRCGRFLDYGIEEPLLYPPSLRYGVLNWGFPDQMPIEVRTLIGERKVVVPMLTVIKEALLASGQLHRCSVGTNLDDYKRHHSREDVSILASSKRRFRERNLAHVGNLTPGELNSEDLHPLLEAEEVFAHDLFGPRLTRGEFVATVEAELGDTPDKSFIRVDLGHRLADSIAEGDHKAGECSVCLTGRDFRPDLGLRSSTHNRFPFAVSSSVITSERLAIRHTIRRLRLVLRDELTGAYTKPQKARLILISESIYNDQLHVSYTITV